MHEADFWHHNTFRTPCDHLSEKVSWSFLGIASSLWIAVIVAFLFPFLMKHAGSIGDFTPIKQVVVLGFPIATANFCTPDDFVSRGGSTLTLGSVRDAYDNSQQRWICSISN
jgi:hypothetical protein